MENGNGEGRGGEKEWQIGVMDIIGEKRKPTLHGAVCTGCITNVISEERALTMPSPCDGGHVFRS